MDVRPSLVSLAAIDGEAKASIPGRASPWRRSMPFISVALPLVLGWCWPRSYGPSLEAFPILLGALFACIASINIRRRPTASIAMWMLLVSVLIVWRGHPYAEYQLLLLPFGLSVWIAIALGTSSNGDHRLWSAVAWAILIAAALNLFVAALQLFHSEALLYPWATRNTTPRPYGNLRQSNHFATLLSIAEIVLWWGASNRRWSLKWVGIAALAGAWGIAISGSRTGLLEISLLAIGVFAWRRSSCYRVCAVFVLLPFAALAFSSLTTISLHWLGFDSASLAQRTAGLGQDARWLHWQAAWQLIQQHPWVGVGWRQFRWARFVDRPQDSLIETAENAHNLPLQLAVELGIPAMSLILLPCVFFCVAAYRRARHDARGRCALLVLGAILIHSLLEFPLWYLNFAFIAGFAVGVVAAPGPAALAMQPRKINKALPLIGALLVAAALFDYDRVAAAYGSSLLSPAQSSAAALAQARQTWFFRAYADYALVTQVPVSEANASAMVALTDRLMRFGPDPAILTAGIMARCASGEQPDRAGMTAEFKLAFPAPYADFVKQTRPDLRVRCGLVPAP